jgi:hypothetical protein
MIKFCNVHVYKAKNKQIIYKKVIIYVFVKLNKL